MQGADRSKEYLRVYQQVTRMISTVLDHQEVMDTIARTLPNLLDIDACSIRLMNEEKNAFVLGAAEGLSQEYLSRKTLDSAETMAMISAGRPVATPDISQVDQPQFRAAAEKEGVCSVLTLPIMFRGAIIGIMRLLTRTHRVFTEDEIDFSVALAEQVGVAISNARLFSQLANKVDMLREVQELSQLANSTLDLDSVLDNIVARLPQVLDVKGCTIRLLDTRSNRLRLEAASGLSQEYLNRGTVEDEANMVKALAGEPVQICDVNSDDRVGYKEHMEREGIRSLLTVPIKDQGEVIGVLRLLSSRFRRFNEAEINFAVTVAEAGGTAINNARTYRKITLLFKQIEEQERFLADILDCIRPRLLVVDKELRIVLANRAFAETAGRSVDQLLGSSYLEHFPVTAQGTSPVEQVLTTGEAASIELEENNLLLEKTATAMSSSGTGVEYVIEVTRDITDQRNLADEQARRSKLEGVVELAGTVAHELNSPLFAALGTAQLMEMDLEEDSEMAEELQTVIRNLKTMQELTRRMTTMTGFTPREYVGETKIIEF
ncbi:MAG: PAS sensor protein [Deltaproteobacteria bacterium]|nr:MAG: PAS sensor protein [Deltaproteobacteria bacterium]